MNISFISFRLRRKHIESHGSGRGAFGMKGDGEDLQLMAQHVVWPICLHFDRMRSCLEEILPAGGQGRDGCWGLPAHGDGESFLLGIRQEKRQICSELFHGTLWLDNAIRQLGAVAFSIKRLYKTKKILSSTVWGMCGLHFLLLREN